MKNYKGLFRCLVVTGFLASTAVFAVANTAPAVAQKYQWKLTSYVPLKSGTWNSYIQRFIDATHLFTSNDVKIKGYGVGVLAGPFDAWKAVKKGTADICYCYPGFALNADPANGILGGMVGGMPMEEFMHWYVAGGGLKLLQDFRHSQGLHPVLTGMGSSEFFMHSHKRVQKISDLKGMKIRTAGAWADILKMVGASATVIPPADIYTALERRVIDATEFITPATNIKLGFHKIAKFIVMPGIHNPSHMNEAVFRLSDWNKLPKQTQQQIEAAGIYSAFQTAMNMGVADVAAVKKLKAGKNTFVNLDAAAIAKVEELGRVWSKAAAKEQTAKGNPWMKRVSESYWGFYDNWKKYSVYRLN